MMTVARAAFTNVGGFDERLPRGHDWDLAARLVETTHWHVLGEPLTWTDRPEGLSDSPEKLERASRVLARKHGRSSPLSRPLAVEFHTGFAHKLLTMGHWLEGLRHYTIAVALAPTRLRNWLYLAAAVPGPWAHRWAARLSRRILGRPLGPPTNLQRG